MPCMSNAQHGAHPERNWCTAQTTTNTMSTYRARIMEKTHTKNDVELALYAQQHSRSPNLR